MAAEEEEFIPVKYKGRKGRGRGKLKGDDYSSRNSDGSSDLSFDSMESKSTSSLGGVKSSSSADFSSDGKDTRELEKGLVLGKTRLRSLGRGRRPSALETESFTSSDFSTDSSVQEVCRLSLYDYYYLLGLECKETSLAQLGRFVKWSQIISKLI